MNRHFLTALVVIGTTLLYSQDCNDGILNGNEIDIDCGGACTPCSNGLSDGQMITVEDNMGFVYRHAIWLPPGYDFSNPYQKLPLIVFFHGNGGNLDNTTQAQNRGPMKYRNESWWNYPFIIVNAVRGGGTKPSDDLKQFIDQIISAYHVDENKVYLAGQSGGSFAIARFTDEYPDEYSAIASISGYSHDPLLSSSILCDEFKGTPIWYFHSERDGVVPFNFSNIKFLADLHEDCGNPSPDPHAFYSIFDDNSHDAWSRVWNPFLNQNNSNYSSQYNLTDLTNLSSAHNYELYHVPFGLPNGVETIYDWFLRHEDLPNNCRNLIQDGDETGIDCGGSCKPCTSTYECHNGVLDIGEIAIDCGGSCPTCEREIIWRNSAWNNASGPLITDKAYILDNISGGFSTKSLFINDGATFTVSGTLEVLEDLENNGTLIISSGASLITYEGFNTSSNVVFQKNTRYEDGRYSFVGIPTEQSSANVTSDLGDNVYTYDETLSASTNDLARWIASNELDELIPGKGYTQANQGLIEIVGIPNTGSITINGSYENDGWHLISNPYPAALDIDAFIDGNPNITGTIYLWDDNGSDSGRGSSNDYIVANKTGAVDLNGIDNSSIWNGNIGSFQGFFVQLDGAPGNIFFTESMRVHDNNSDANFFRKQPPSKLTITYEQDGLELRTMVVMTTEASNNELTAGYDAVIYDPLSENGFYSVKSDRALGIQAISRATQKIPLRYSTSKSGDAMLSFSAELWDEDYYLIDQMLGSSIKIEKGGEYSFSTSIETSSERFVIQKAEKILGEESSTIRFYTYRKTLYFTSNESEVDLQIFDLNGRIQKQLKARNSTKIDLSFLLSGIYIITDGFNKRKVLLE